MNDEQKIANPKGLFYELGVLMFNTVADHEHSLAFNNDFDGLGNFVSLINAVGDIELGSLKDGFVSECQNYNIPVTEAEELFQKTLITIETN